MRRIAAAIVFLTVLVAGTAAAGTACPEHYAKGRAPEIVNPRMAQKAQEICYPGFGLKHSGLSRSALWAGEHLTRARLANAKKMERNDAFHEDPHLDPSVRADLDDYARSGFDRGHLAPSADMPDEESQHASFSLANMIPQVGANNRGIWSEIEKATRAMANKRGELYVLTGPLYLGEHVRALRGRVLVPTHIFKVVYDPRTDEAGAYLIENAATTKWKAVPVAEIERLSGINLLPGVSDEVKQRGMDLYKPRTYGGQRADAGEDTPAGGFAFTAAGHVLHWAVR